MILTVARGLGGTEDSVAADLLGRWEATRAYVTAATTG